MKPKSGGVLSPKHWLAAKQMKYAPAILMAPTPAAAVAHNGARITVAEYEELLALEVRRYKLASQQVNGPIYGIAILSDQSDRFLTPTLELASGVFTNAISNMNAEYMAQVEREVPSQFTAHHDSVVEAWRYGIARWNIDHSKPNDSLIERLKALFGIEMTSLAQIPEVHGGAAIKRTMDSP
jgi:hypothetical protein